MLLFCVLLIETYVTNIDPTIRPNDAVRMARFITMLTRLETATQVGRSQLIQETKLNAEKLR